MIRKRKGGKYLEWWRNQEMKGKADKRRDRPKRDILAIQNALKKLKLRYCQEVSFWSETHIGRHGNLDGGLQWMDFIVKKGSRGFAILHDDKHKREKRYEKVYHSNKIAEMWKRDIPLLILPEKETSQSYYIRIYRFMKQKGML